MNNSNIYCTAFGLSQKGQLGGQAPAIAQGAKNGAQVFATLNGVQIPNPLPGRNFLKISSGESHNIFLSDNLKILSCGSNVYGQLGDGAAYPLQNQGQNQSMQGQQQQICAIQSIREYVDNEDGVGKNGQKEAQLTQQNHEFAHVACGAEHSFALSTTGELYSWGLGFKGQLGQGDFENKMRPTLVKNVSPSFLESGQLDELLNANQNSSKRSKSRENVGGGGQTARDPVQEGLGNNKQIFNATQKPSKSMDLTGGVNNLDDGQTGLPEQDDEILRQLNQMT